MSDDELRGFVRRALAEDIGQGDITTGAVIPADARARGTVVQKDPGLIFGYEPARMVFAEVDSEIVWQELAGEAVWRDPPASLVEVTGSARSILIAERTALNFLQHLSGVATLTARFVQAVQGADTKILDTRKTIPGLRRLEKQAVRAGGGVNHRMGLYDAILIKENHIEVAGGVAQAVRKALDTAPQDLVVEVECSSLEEVEEAVEAGAKRLLLDNMSPNELRRAGELVAGRAELEASGGVSLETVGEIATTPVQYISVGALTHSAPALDLSLELKVI